MADSSKLHAKAAGQKRKRMLAIEPKRHVALTYASVQQQSAFDHFRQLVSTECFYSVPSSTLRAGTLGTLNSTLTTAAKRRRLADAHGHGALDIDV